MSETIDDSLLITFKDSHDKVELSESTSCDRPRKISSVHRTIVRTPISSNYFPKLTLKKNLKSCPPKPLITDQERQEQLDYLNAKNSKGLCSFSPLDNVYISTPPFVTMTRPAPRNLSSFLSNNRTDGSCNNSTEVKVSDLKFFESILPKIHSTPTNIEVKKQCQKNSSIETINVSPNSPKYIESEIDQDMASLMDNIYGNAWRSTPGLFKKKKPRRTQGSNDVFDDLLSKISSINLSGENDKKDESTDIFNDSVVLLNDVCDDLNKIYNKSVPQIDGVQDLKTLKEKNRETFEISGVEDEEKRFNNEIFHSNILDENLEKDLKPKKLYFDDKHKKLKSTKENFDPSTKKKISKKIEKDANKNQKVSENKPLKSGDLNFENIQQYSFMASLSENVLSWRMEYKAKHYRDNFKKKKDELAGILFKLFNENVFDSKISPKLPIVWSTTLNKTAGRAHNKLLRSKDEFNKTTTKRCSKIELSIKVVDTAQRLRDTLAHELCHVASWLIDGQLHDNHGSHWKTWVKKVLKQYPELKSIPVCHSYDIHFKYSYKCIKCGYKVNRHSKSIDTSKKRCGYCYGTFECILNKKTKDGLIVSTPSKQRNVVNGFALYVKENYSNARSGSTPHKDVMKYLGQQYSKLKEQSQDLNDK